MFISELFFYFSVAVIVAVFGTQPWARRRALAVSRSLFFASVLVAISYLTYLGYLQYQAFKDGPLSTTLGTTHGLSWFFGYIRLHFFNEYLISLIAAFLLIFIAQYINRKRGHRHFETDELYTVALCIFLVGYPGFIFYIPLVLIVSAIASALFVRHGERLPLYYFWAPTAILVLLAIHFLVAHQAWWISFRF